jgi:hypothetical protein
VSLELSAMEWLRFDRRCQVVVFERTPRDRWLSRPDVLGVTANRYCYEIEIKRTFSDFIANQNKLCVRNRDHYIARWPRYYSFLVHPDIVDRVTPLVPEWSGLLTVGQYGEMRVIKAAPENSLSRKLSLKECVRLALLSANQVISAERKAQSLCNSFRDGIEPWPTPIYEI